MSMLQAMFLSSVEAPICITCLKITNLYVNDDSQADVEGDMTLKHSLVNFGENLDFVENQLKADVDPLKKDNDPLMEDNDSLKGGID